MNFAHLTSFQAIEFMDWPVSKMLDISVCQTSHLDLSVHLRGHMARTFNLLATAFVQAFEGRRLS